MTMTLQAYIFNCVSAIPNPRCHFKITNFYVRDSQTNILIRRICSILEHLYQKLYPGKLKLVNLNGLFALK